MGAVSNKYLYERCHLRMLSLPQGELTTWPDACDPALTLPGGAYLRSRVSVSVYLWTKYFTTNYTKQLGVCPLLPNEGMIDIHFELYWTLSAGLLSWRRRPSSVRPLSVKPGFATVAWTRAKFYGKLPSISTYPPYRQLQFFRAFLIWDPLGENFQNTTPLTVFIRPEPNFMINKVVMGEYKVIMFWQSAKN